MNLRTALMPCRAVDVGGRWNALMAASRGAVPGSRANKASKLAGTASPALGVSAAEVLDTTPSKSTWMTNGAMGLGGRTSNTSCTDSLRLTEPGAPPPELSLSVRSAARATTETLSVPRVSLPLGESTGRGAMDERSCPATSSALSDTWQMPYLMREAIRGHQRSSEVIRGHQRSSEHVMWQTPYVEALPLRKMVLTTSCISLSSSSAASSAVASFTASFESGASVNDLEKGSA